MRYNEEQRGSIIKESIGKTITDLEYVERDRYWVMSFSDGSEMSFRFMAELENRILTSGHDRDMIQGKLVYDLADDGDEYVKINGKKQVLVKNDIVLKDDEGVLASILFGPASRTSIDWETVNPLYFAWCPVGIDYETVDMHLSTITKYSKIVYGEKIESARHII